MQADRLRALADRLLLYPRTLRHLTARQLLALPRSRLDRFGRRGAVPAATGATCRDDLAARVRGFGPRNAEWSGSADAVREGIFEFVGHREVMRPVDWGCPGVSHLWRFNLHYFDYGLDLAWAFVRRGQTSYRDTFLALARSWIDGNAPGVGDGWAPYTVSIRTGNWIYSLLLIGDAIPPEDRAAIEASLLVQLAWLERRMERHLGANHLQRNLQALTVAGIYFAGDAATRWRTKHSAELWDEVLEQVLPDGAHYERSPMYHLIAAADLLETTDLVRAAGGSVPDEVRERLTEMVHATSSLVRPDGRLHLFNDAAEGVAPATGYVDSLAQQSLGVRRQPVRQHLTLADAGYFGFHDKATGDRLLVDCGDPGPAYQPGHAHADLLSFELDLRGVPVIVDSGVAGYGGDPLREYVRSTRAHNTLMIDGREQHELWGSFRIARRATILGGHDQHVAGRYSFTGSYSPYHSRRIVHSRIIDRARDGEVTIHDVVSGGPDSVESFLHLHPEAQVMMEPGAATLTIRDRRVSIVLDGFDSLTVVSGAEAPVQGWHCERFGAARPAPCLVGRIRGRDVAESRIQIRMLE
jgi:uncharacterized heparinase superfamily protein